MKTLTMWMAFMTIMTGVARAQDQGRLPSINQPKLLKVYVDASAVRASGVRGVSRREVQVDVADALAQGIAEAEGINPQNVEAYVHTMNERKNYFRSDREEIDLTAVPANDTARSIIARVGGTVTASQSTETLKLPPIKKVKTSIRRKKYKVTGPPSLSLVDSFDYSRRPSGQRTLSIPSRSSRNTGINIRASAGFFGSLFGNSFEYDKSGDVNDELADAYATTLNDWGARAGQAVHAAAVYARPTLEAKTGPFKVSFTAADKGTIGFFEEDRALQEALFNKVNQQRFKLLVFLIPLKKGGTTAANVLLENGKLTIYPRANIRTEDVDQARVRTKVEELVYGSARQGAAN